MGSVKNRLLELERKMKDSQSVLYIEGLLDSIGAIVKAVDTEALRKDVNVKRFLERYTRAAENVADLRMRKSDYDTVQVVGRGAFGEVQLVRHKDSKKVFAMKILSKSEMIIRSDVAFFWEEKYIMAHANSPWIVQLHYAFQDKRHLYMVMDFMPGGDLVSLMTNYDIPEEWACFYTAELVLAVEALHGMGFVHRDVKPDNMLIDSTGHVKLTDFGTCARFDSDGIVRSCTAVGTPDYISPEVLRSQSQDLPYGKECDWWSVGVFIYEMLVGDTPFISESLVGTYGNIMKHDKDLILPSDVTLSRNAESIINEFLRDKSIRLGTKGTAEIKSHPFFVTNKWNWDTIRDSVAPVIPELKDDADTCNFDIAGLPKEAKISDDSHAKENKGFNAFQLPFVGFSFSKDEQLFMTPASSGLTASESTTDLEDTLAFEMEKVEEMEAQCKSLKNRLDKLSIDFDETVESKKEVENNLVLANRSIEELEIKMHRDTEIKLKLESKIKSLNKMINETLTKSSLSSSEHLSQVSLLESRVVELEKQSAHEQDCTVKAKKQCAELTMQRNAADNLLSESQERFRSLNASKSALEGTLLETQCDLDNELEKLNELYKSKRILEKTLANLQSEFQRVKESFVKEKLTTESLRLQLGRSEDEKCDLELGLKRSSALCEELKSKLVLKDSGEQITYGKLEEEIASRQKVESLKTDYQRQCLTLSNDLKEANACIAELKEQNEDLDREKVKIAEELDNSNMSNNDLLSEVKLLRKAKNNEKYLTRQIDDLEAEIKSSLEELSKQRRNCNKMELDLRESEGQLDTEQTFTTLYKNKSNELELDIVEKDDVIAKLRSHLAFLKDEVSNLDSEKSGLEDALSKTVSLKQMDDMKEINLNLNLKINDINSSHQKLIQDRDNKICELSESNDRHFAGISKLRKEKDEVNRKLKLSMSDVHMTKKLPESGDDILLQVERLNNQLQTEIQFKIAAVNKLSEVLSRKDYKPISKGKKAPKSTNDDYKKLHKEFIKLESNLHQEKMKYNDLAETSQVDKDALTYLQQETSRKNYGLNLELDKINHECAELRKRLLEKNGMDYKPSGNLGFEDMVDGSGRFLSKKGWLQIPKGKNIKRQGWQRQYVVLTARDIFFYKSEGEVDSCNPIVIINIDKLYIVRSINPQDAIHVDSKDLPKIFQIMYAGEGESRNVKEPLQIQSAKDDALQHKGHELILVHYHIPTPCDACYKQIVGLLIKSVPAYECRLCKMKLHREHLDNEDSALPPCKTKYDPKTARELLLMADSKEDKAHWLSMLTSLVPKKGAGTAKGKLSTVPDGKSQTLPTKQA